MVGPPVGRTELEALPKDWALVPLGQLCNLTAGGDLKSDHYAPRRDHVHQFPIYANATIQDTPHGYSISYEHEPGSVTVTARGIGVGRAVYRNTRFCAIGRLLVL